MGEQSRSLNEPNIVCYPYKNVANKLLSDEKHLDARRKRAPKRSVLPYMSIGAQLPTQQMNASRRSNRKYVRFLLYLYN
ncbi:hypothetical protein HCB69_09760 [Listeria booriae]|uniref:Uncharacterized protein n=1 Tax=Listeria booriae TaxID=1552123 RepID=A0A842G322_9LIST|nr:hypothetical protein [Listeria booriae]MBC2284664.1 hypothetical protein [Listeria booriae]MBC2293480.1 hypothetical protein [Listeria booriae]